MKRLKLVSFLAVICMLLGNLVHGQVILDPTDPQPIAVNTFNRTPCLAGYLGCSNATISLKLSATFGATTKSITSSSSNTFPFNQTHIKVTIGTLSSVGDFTLPTAIGDQIVINPTDGIAPYGVIITKTATREFRLEVSNMAF